MLSFNTASLTNVPGHTASRTCCLVTNCPAFSTSNFKTANGFGRSEIARVPCHKHWLMRSSQNGPNDMWLLDCITKTSCEHAHRTSLQSSGHGNSGKGRITKTSPEHHS